MLLDDGHLLLRLVFLVEGHPACRQAMLLAHLAEVDGKGGVPGARFVKGAALGLGGLGAAEIEGLVATTRLMERAAFVLGAAATLGDHLVRSGSRYRLVQKVGSFSLGTERGHYVAKR